MLGLGVPEVPSYEELPVRNVAVFTIVSRLTPED